MPRYGRAETSKTAARQDGHPGSMILVTGATGTIGSRVSSLLTARDVPFQAMTRDPSRLRSRPGVDVIAADYEDPTSLAGAVTGVETLFLLTVAIPPSPQHDLAMLSAARRAGVTRVVRLSAIASGEHAPDGGVVGAWHAQADEAVQASGMAWTLLRPTTFASNSLWWADAIRAGQPIPNMTGTGQQGIVDPADVAAVAVEALLSPTHASKVYTLTGPELLSVHDQAAILAAALGRDVEVSDTPPDEARRLMLASGMDRDAVEAMSHGMSYVRGGHNAVVTDDVTRLLGRPPTTFATWVSGNLTAFTPDGSL
jgi:uncharacterized protein YbjT (DUF2867 family)